MLSVVVALIVWLSCDKDYVYITKKGADVEADVKIVNDKIYVPHRGVEHIAPIKTQDGTELGTLTIKNDEENIYITFSGVESAKFEDLYLFVGPLEEFPIDSKGNVNIEEFPYNNPFTSLMSDISYTIPLINYTDSITVAAYVEMYSNLKSGGSNNSSQKAWAIGIPINGENSGYHIGYKKQYFPWTNDFGGGTTGIPYYITETETRNIYVVGNYEERGIIGYSIAAKKLDRWGNTISENRYIYPFTYTYEPGILYNGISPTDDGGYIICGIIDTIPTPGNINGGDNFHIIKLDNNFNYQWDKIHGGVYLDRALCVIQTKEGGYVACGCSRSKNGFIGNILIDDDYWIVKLDINGDIEWQKYYGGNDNEAAYDIIQTNDGGYIVAGHTFSKDGDVSGNKGLQNYWIVKLDSNGDLEWEKCFGGTDYDYARSIIQTNDGGYIVAGSAHSYDGDIPENYATFDCWIIKLDRNGNIEWNKCYGGNAVDYAEKIIQTSDGGYAVAGSSFSTDIEGSENKGFMDCLVIKLDESGNIEWQRCYGTEQWDYGHSIIETSDGGYAVTGYNNSGWLVVTIDKNGMVDTPHYVE